MNRIPFYGWDVKLVVCRPTSCITITMTTKGVLKYNKVSYSGVAMMFVSPDFAQLFDLIHELYASSNIVFRRLCTGT